MCVASFLVLGAQGTSPRLIPQLEKRGVVQVMGHLRGQRAVSPYRPRPETVVMGKSLPATTAEPESLVQVLAFPTLWSFYGHF